MHIEVQKFQEEKLDSLNKGNSFQKIQETEEIPEAPKPWKLLS